MSLFVGIINVIWLPKKIPINALWETKYHALTIRRHKPIQNQYLYSDFLNSRNYKLSWAIETTFCQQ